jgi:flagellar motility protein MotE (MotC chaperone)
MIWDMTLNGEKGELNVIKKTSAQVDRDCKALDVELRRLLVQNREMTQECEQIDTVNEKLRAFFEKQKEPEELPSFVVDHKSGVGESITKMLLEHGYTKERLCPKI